MKKLLAIMLAVVLAAGMTTVGFAASLGKITTVNQAISQKDYGDMTVAPGQVIELPLTANLFDWEDGTGGEKDPVTTTQLNNGKVTVKVSYEGKSKDVIKEISIASKVMSAADNQKTAYIKIEFLEEYTGVAEKEFEFTVYLAVRGNRVKDSAVTFIGTFKNKTIVVDSDEDYVDLSGGEVAEAEEYLRSVDVYIGAGIIIRTKMYKDKQYYGVAESGVSESDEKILDAYPEISEVYTLKTVNLSSGTVIFDDVDDKYHVYDEDGKYVGTTDDELKYSSKFYLAKNKIDMGSKSSSKDEDEDEDEEIIPAEEVEEDTVPSYSNDNYDYSLNDNPSTGVGGAISGVCVIAVSSLAMMALTGKRFF